jgi:hypothetical protein
MWFGVSIITEWQALEQGTSQGEIGISGTFQVPRHDSFCSEFEVLRMVASIGYETEKPRQTSEKARSSALSLIETYPVQGAAGRPEGPCVYYKDYTQDFKYEWGEPVEWTVLAETSPEQEIEIFFGDGPPALIWNRVDEPADEGGLWGPKADVDVVIPVGSPGGALEVLVDGEEVEKGAGLASQYRIPKPRDYADPENDEWTQAQEDVWEFFGNVPFWGPELAFTERDQTPAPNLNPFGSGDYGRGDWWLLPIDNNYRLCILVETDPAKNDEFDVYLVNESGQFVNTSFFDGGFYEWHELDVQSGDDLYLWAAPSVIRSEYGWYGMLAQDCSYWGTPPTSSSSESWGRGRTRTSAPVPTGVAHR